MSESFAELKAMSDDQLIAEHDRRAKNTSVGTQHYEDELNRRAQEREAQAMRELAEASHKLSVRTFWLSVMTVVTSLSAVVVAVVTLIITANAS